MNAAQKAAIRSSEIGWCIICSLASITQEEWEVVMPWFLHEFLPCHHTFIGDQPLEAFRATKHPISMRNWSDRWGGLMSHWCSMGYMDKLGKGTVTAIHSHMDELCYYQSNYYTGRKPAPRAIHQADLFT